MLTFFCFATLSMKLNLRKGAAAATFFLFATNFNFFFFSESAQPLKVNRILIPEQGTWILSLIWSSNGLSSLLAINVGSLGTALLAVVKA